MPEDSIAALGLGELGSSVFGRSETASQIKPSAAVGSTSIGNQPSRVYRLECSHHLSGTVNDHC